jgi:hypothetical protein
VATGREPSERGGVLAPVDVRGAGGLSWAEVAGVNAGHPLVRDGNTLGWDTNRRVVTTPEGQAGPATGGLIATPDGAGEFPGLAAIDDWRDIINFKGSPVPWILLIALGVLTFAHASVQARAGAFGKTASARAALE